MKKTSYSVEITHDVFDVENATLANLLKAVSGVEKPRVLLVADMNFVQRNDGVGLKIGAYVQQYGIELAGSPVVFGGGEKLKTDGFGSVLAAINACVKAMLGANDIVLALGGGSVFDVVGVATSMVHGGLKVVRIPTTPAAMFGAAFAETAAVNAAGVKDAAAVKSVPAGVVIDPQLAASVLDGVWSGGFGEVVRVAAVTDASLAKRLAECAADYRKRDLKLLDELVAAVAAVRAKKTVPEFATWFAARLEAMSGWKLPHGYAIPMAITVESAYAVEKGLMKESDREIVMKALRDSCAIDGAYQSKSLLLQPVEIFRGLREWAVQNDGAGEVIYPSGLGKIRKELPDEAIYLKVFGNLTGND